MKKPLVSVLTPAYNAEKYIGEAIESILTQSFSEFEFIIADDSSSDQTWAIVQKYASRDKRIIAIRNQNNLYIAANRNHLLSMAQGKYIVWQDADDISQRDRLEIQVEFMESHPKVGVCGGNIQSFNNRGLLDIRRYAEDDTSLRKNIFKFSPIAQPISIIRKECLDTVGHYDIGLPPAEDLDLWFRIGERYEFANIPKVLLMYREQEGNATYSKMRKMLEKTLQIRKRYQHAKAYRYKPSDHVAFLTTALMQYIPAEVVVPFFKLLRQLFNQR